MSAERKLSLAQRAQQSVEEVRLQNAQLDKLKVMDQDISEVETIISEASGATRNKVVQEVGVELEDLKVERLGTLLGDADTRGRYLARKKPQITAMVKQVSQIKPGSEGKEQLNALVQKAIMSGFLEGSQLADSKIPDIGNLRIPQVESKPATDLLYKLQREINEIETKSITRALQFARGLRNPFQLQEFVQKVSKLGWIKLPLPLTSLKNLDFEKLEAPAVTNPRVQASYLGLVAFIQKKGGELLDSLNRK
ncbi:hypothetical protein ACFL3T_00865 [Patescibacteria group bacterium]